jgi:hypothetical protein
LLTELSGAFTVDLLTGKERDMARPARNAGVRQLPDRDRDFLCVDRKRAIAKPPSPLAQRTGWPPVPDLFDVITYFRARGDSFALIGSIGFWVGENPTKALSARGLKLWYEGELERRSAARAAIR